MKVLGLLSAILLFLCTQACTSGGDKFLGKWTVLKGQPSFLCGMTSGLEITKRGQMYVVERTGSGNVGDVCINKEVTTYKNDCLIIESGGRTGTVCMEGNKLIFNLSQAEYTYEKQSTDKVAAQSQQSHSDRSIKEALIKAAQSGEVALANLFFNAHSTEETITIFMKDPKYNDAKSPCSNVGGPLYRNTPPGPGFVSIMPISQKEIKIEARDCAGDTLMWKSLFKD